MKKLLNFIDGEFVEPVSGEYFESYNPAEGKPHLLVSDSDARDVEAAVQSAEWAFKPWSKTAADERAKVLYRIADGIDARLKELAEAESADQGKPEWLARRMDIPRASLNFRFFAGAVLHQQEHATRIDQNTFNYVARKPVGVAGLISPWNLPLYLLTWKIAPAIAYGNTCVAKPSEITPYTASLLAEIMSKAGLPKGVVNIVFGTGPKAGAALVAHSKTPLISFTGGTATGKTIASVAAPMFKKLSLELGGKNPNIIFDDADLEMAVTRTVNSSFLNQGEICLCGSRIYVQRKVYDKFMEKFLAKVRELKVGDPKEHSTFIGPLVSKEHLEKVASFMDVAKKEGVKIETGGVKPEMAGRLKDGYFFAPTVLTGVKHESRIQQEEIFGPVVSVTPFDEDMDAVNLANGVSYGLSASIWTKSLRRAHFISDSLDAGTVWVNTWLLRDLRAPFGGVKASGVGREGQDGSLDFFTEQKTICIHHGPEADQR